MPVQETADKHTKQINIQDNQDMNEIKQGNVILEGSWWFRVGEEKASQKK